MAEQVALYETITGEHPRVEPEPEPDSDAGADVLPMRRRREQR